MPELFLLKLESDPLMALQWVMQRRARHVAKVFAFSTNIRNFIGTFCQAFVLIALFHFRKNLRRCQMLDLKWKAENCRETHFLHFARFLDSRLLKAEEETNKKTRQVMLFLERLRREESVNPKRCSQEHSHEMNGRIST